MDASAHVSPDAVPLFMSEIVAMGGAERSMLALGRWLQAHRRPVYLLTYFDRVGLAGHAGFPLPTVQLNPHNRARAKIAVLARYLRDRSRAAPALLTSGYQPALHCALARTGRFHCLMHDTPSLFAGDNPSPLQRLRFRVLNWQIGRAMRRHRGVMIVTSNYLQQQCRRDFHLHAEIARMGGLASGHTFRRRPVTSLTRFPGDDSISASESPSNSTHPGLNLLSVSRMEGNKRIDWLLDALATQEQAPVPLSARADWRLDLAGAGSQLADLRARAEARGLGRRVRFHGFVPDEQLQALYEEAHLFLMPAVQGYGIPAVEALARGIPVLLHRDSGVSDLLLNTPWATVVTGGPDDLTAKLACTLDWLLSNGHLTAPPAPELPTEDTWAERVASLCGYV